MSRFGHRPPFPSDRFIGRRRELDEITSRILHHGQSAALIGEPRIGKTSLLKHLASPAALGEIPPSSPSRLLFSHVNAHTLETDFNQARFWSEILEHHEDSGTFDSADTPLGVAYRNCQQKSFDTRSMERLLRRLGAAQLRLVVLIDEFDYLVDRCVARHSEFFASLRALAIGDHRALAVIAATRRSIAQLNELAREHGYNGSPYFNTFAEVLLGPLSDTEIDELLLPAQDRFSPEERRLIHDLSGGYPYLVQTAADILWRAHGSAPEPAARRRAAGAELLRVASQMLNDIWVHWPPRMRYLFASVAVEHLGVLSRRVESVVDTASFPEEIHALERHGMIGRNERGPSGFVVKPIIFLAWCAVLLRKNSQSPTQWRTWMHAEGWETLLSPRRKELWEGSLRERAGNAQTDIEVLLQASTALLASALGG